MLRLYNFSLCWSHDFINMFEISLVYEHNLTLNLLKKGYGIIGEPKKFDVG